MTTQSRSFTSDLIAPARATPSPIAAIAGFFAQIFLFARGRRLVWKMRFDDRAHLADLQQFQLNEMGMTLDQRDREVNKPFWEE
jgi:uncharacterized protein YjiS (DUF1127 family)